MIFCSPCQCLLLCQNGLVSLLLLLLLLLLLPPLHLPRWLCPFPCRCPSLQTCCYLSARATGVQGAFNCINCINAFPRGGMQQLDNALRGLGL